MSKRTRWTGSGLALAALVWVGCLAAQQGGAVTTAVPAVSPAPAEHPEVEETWETCDGCHRDVSPEVVEAWFASDHGLNNVKCFVCHGSVGDDFHLKPDATTCASCHEDWVASMGPASMGPDIMSGKDCFTCHAPHALDPHGLDEERE